MASLEYEGMPNFAFEPSHRLDMPASLPITPVSAVRPGAARHRTLPASSAAAAVPSAAAAVPASPRPLRVPPGLRGTPPPAGAAPSWALSNALPGPCMVRRDPRVTQLPPLKS